jgi:hypothetical protein
MVVILNNEFLIAALIDSKIALQSWLKIILEGDCIMRKCFLFDIWLQK